MVYEKEGWEVVQMPKSRDGGKDVIAKQIVAGVPVVAYVQAKRYSQSHPVGISVIKEFVATVAGDGVDKGFIVTTSYFSKPSVGWLNEKGASLATVELVDRLELEKKMQQIADLEMAAYLVQ